MVQNRARMDKILKPTSLYHTPPRPPQDWCIRTEHGSNLMRGWRPVRPKQIGLFVSCALHKSLHTFFTFHLSFYVENRYLERLLFPFSFLSSLSLFSFSLLLLWVPRTRCPTHTGWFNADQQRPRLPCTQTPSRKVM